MELKFLFWNVGNLPSPFEDTLDHEVKSNSIDVLILVEGASIPASVIEKKTGLKSVELQLKNKTKKWVQVFYNDGLGVTISHKSERTSKVDENDDDVVFNNDAEIENEEKNPMYKEVNRIQLFAISGNVEDTLFACIHFPSKLQHDELTHTEVIPPYKNKIEEVSGKNERVFIVGDFNMSPFDLGMLQPTGFYTHHNRSLVTEDKRSHPSGKQSLYYNPCWNLLGDFPTEKDYATNKRVGGTFHFLERKSKKLYWYLIDQVIMRKALMDEFDSKYLKIVENQTYIDEILQPAKKIGASKVPKLDHLPIRFSFNFKNK